MIKYWDASSGTNGPIFVGKTGNSTGKDNHRTKSVTVNASLTNKR